MVNMTSRQYWEGKLTSWIKKDTYENRFQTP